VGGSDFDETWYFDSGDRHRGQPDEPPH